VERRSEQISQPYIISAIKERIEQLALTETLKTEDRRMKQIFADRFPDDLPPVDDLPTDVYHRITLKDANRTFACRDYTCPRRYRDAWMTLIQQHLEAGRIRPSNSPVCSPSFLTPKADPKALPRWVNDYRELNANTVPDRFPLPRIDNILADCAKAKIWGKIDMTNSFFQTRVHPDDIHLTAISTPFGLYEWPVMPMGGCNAPATHQRRMTAALRHLIGKICHVYLDDIIIWSQSLEEHRKNVELVLEALRQSKLYCSVKKSDLFCTDIIFLGHRISARGIEPDSAKTDKIASWPRPKSCKEVRAFLGLVRYVATFLPKLADLTAILTPLTAKTAEEKFPDWKPTHEKAFQAIKALVLSAECLTVIDHENPGNRKIWVTTDASEIGTGATLSFGETWESSRPVAFDSTQLDAAQKNYPTHEKELLAVVRALKKWRMDLLGSDFTVCTDHKTLLNFNTQRDLSRRQARWQEFLAQYTFEWKYVRGEDNSAADALSRMIDPNATPATVAACMAVKADSTPIQPDTPVAPVLQITENKDLMEKITKGYAADKFATKLLTNLDSFPNAKMLNNLLFIGGRLVIPSKAGVKETLFQVAHDAMGHFGFEKSYASLRASFYWPNMRKELETAYIPACPDCQRNKSTTSAPAGPLHPLPIPDERGDSVAIDFIGPLPEDNGYNGIMTMTDRIGADIRMEPVKMSISAKDAAQVFFDEWYCNNGLPLEIVSDCDKLFTSRFWKHLHKLTGVSLKMSTAYHPQTDGASEQTNKIAIQCIRYHVNRNQKGWKRALPWVRFHIMNSLNASTGFSRFQLTLGRAPRVLPPLTKTQMDSLAKGSGRDGAAIKKIIRQLELDELEAKDNLMAAKVTQADQANRHRRPDDFKLGDEVLVSTLHRRREYKKKGEKRVAKFMPRWDGPYRVIKAHTKTSTYELDMHDSPRTYLVFHASQLKKYNRNDDRLFPGRQLERPGPIETENGALEHLVKDIIRERGRKGAREYLVRWEGYGDEEREWIREQDLEDTEALEEWLRRNDDDYAESDEEQSEEGDEENNDGGPTDDQDDDAAMAEEGQARP